MNVGQVHSIKSAPIDLKMAQQSWRAKSRTCTKFQPNRSNYGRDTANLTGFSTVRHLGTRWPGAEIAFLGYPQVWSTAGYDQNLGCISMWVLIDSRPQCGRPPEKYCLPAPLSDLALPLPSCLNGAFKCLEREGREEESGEIFGHALYGQQPLTSGNNIPPSLTHEKPQ